MSSFPRFNSRYLWAKEHLIKGEADVTWGFLDDIWYWTNNKTSPFDPVVASGVPKSANRRSSNSANRSFSKRKES